MADRYTVELGDFFDQADSAGGPQALDHAPYSDEPKVRDRIRRICAEDRGWAGEDGCMVAVALFTKDPDLPGDRADQLLNALRVRA